jgi:hypothetical protein
LLATVVRGGSGESLSEMSRLAMPIKSASTNKPAIALPKRPRRRPGDFAAAGEASALPHWEQ